MKKLGDGVETKLWDDRWLEEERLKERFGRLYQLEQNKRALIAERGEFVRGKWRWKWDWRRMPRGRELGELDSLRVVLEGVMPKRG